MARAYAQACHRADEACPAQHRVVGRLVRPLHFPRLSAGRCPASRGRPIADPDFGGGALALGGGPVLVVVENAGDLRQGRAHPAPYHGWLALKAHFVSPPAYQGPFIVRARELGQKGPIALGPMPRQAAPLVVPQQAANRGAAGWREQPSFTFVKAPGCYAWQVDGLTFSEVVVVRVLREFHG